MRAVLKAQINKTDRNDARGMAQMMRVGIYRLVHDSFTVRTKVEQQVFQCEFQSVFSQWTNQHFRHWIAIVQRAPRQVARCSLYSRSRIFCSPPLLHSTGA
jgi:hypothetical protein